MYIFDAYIKLKYKTSIHLIGKKLCIITKHYKFIKKSVKFKWYIYAKYSLKQIKNNLSIFPVICVLVF